MNYLKIKVIALSILCMGSLKSGDFELSMPGIEQLEGAQISSPSMWNQAKAWWNGKFAKTPDRAAALLSMEERERAQFPVKQHVVDYDKADLASDVHGIDMTEHAGRVHPDLEAVVASKRASKVLTEATAKNRPSVAASATSFERLSNAMSDYDLQDQPVSQGLSARVMATLRNHPKKSVAVGLAAVGSAAYYAYKKYRTQPLPRRVVAMPVISPLPVVTPVRVATPVHPAPVAHVATRVHAVKLNRGRVRAARMLAAQRARRAVPQRRRARIQANRKIQARRNVRGVKMQKRRR